MREWAIPIAAFVGAIAAPAWLLRERSITPVAVRPATTTLPGVTAASPLRAALRPGVFSRSDADTPAAGVPELVGIAGRLPDDAVALVRTVEGRTRSLAVGDITDGWRLDSVAPDAALFERDGQRVRIDLPAAEDPPQ